MKETEIGKSTLRNSSLLNHKDLNASQIYKQRKISKLKTDFKMVQSKIKSYCLASVFEKEVGTNIATNSTLYGIDIAALKNHLWLTKDKYKRDTVILCNRRSNINSLMHMTLFSWLLEVSLTFRLSCRTIFLCGNVFDRFTRSTEVNPKNLQLLGLTCLHIASKFEDINPPRVSDFCLLVDNIYNPSQIIDLETKILQVLKYELVFVSPLDLVDINMTELGCNKPTHDTAVFVLQLFLVHGSISQFECFSMAAFACDFALKLRLGVEDNDYMWSVNQKDIEKFSSCFSGIISVARTYELNWINRRIELFIQVV